MAYTSLTSSKAKEEIKMSILSRLQRGAQQSGHGDFREGQEGSSLHLRQLVTSPPFSSAAEAVQPTQPGFHLCPAEPGILTSQQAWFQKRPSGALWLSPSPGSNKDNSTMEVVDSKQALEWNEGLPPDVNGGQVGSLHLALVRQHTLPQPGQRHRKPAGKRGLSNRGRLGLGLG